MTNTIQEMSLSIENLKSYAKHKTHFEFLELAEHFDFPATIELVRLLERSITLCFVEELSPMNYKYIG